MVNLSSSFETRKLTTKHKNKNLNMPKMSIKVILFVLFLINSVDSDAEIMQTKSSQYML